MVMLLHGKWNDRIFLCLDHQLQLFWPRLREIAADGCNPHAVAMEKKPVKDSERPWTFHSSTMWGLFVVGQHKPCIVETTCFEVHHGQRPRVCELCEGTNPNNGPALLCFHARVWRTEHVLISVWLSASRRPWCETAFVRSIRCKGIITPFSSSENPSKQNHSVWLWCSRSRHGFGRRTKGLACFMLHVSSHNPMWLVLSPDMLLLISRVNMCLGLFSVICRRNVKHLISLNCCREIRFSKLQDLPNLPPEHKTIVSHQGALRKLGCQFGLKTMDSSLGTQTSPLLLLRLTEGS